MDVITGGAAIAFTSLNAIDPIVGAFIGALIAVQLISAKTVYVYF